VYVVPTHRGKGIYTAMYQKVKDIAREEGIPQIRLYVDKDNTNAERVYNQLGMAECHYLMFEEEI
jgi:RimJ/RimL family protein N-acetyltransferase